MMRVQQLLGCFVAFACPVAPAQATTIVQTVTDSKAVPLSSVSFGSNRLTDDAVFDATFLPFVGASLHAAGPG